MSISSIPDPETAVRARYGEAAHSVQPNLCCAVRYDPRYLAAIPQEVLERDYGCGDPSAYVRPGETVLDLGSGGGKVCFIAAQIVGPTGRVVGVDCNPDMLALARRNQPLVAERLGYGNVEFRSGLIQDLRLDLDALAVELAGRPVNDAQSWLGLRSLEQRLRQERPLVADDSFDCVLSNCVLNLVRPEDRHQLFAEVFRVLRPGGRAAISDIVANADVPEELQRDHELWSGCVSGAFREDAFLQAFEDVGFHGIRLASRDAQPWRVVAGIEFRAVTVLAFKAEPMTAPQRRMAVIYCGPFRTVEEFGQRFVRGQRTAVSESVFRMLQREPYAGLFEPVEALPEAMEPGPQETRGRGYRVTVSGDSCCEGGSCC
jgi:ubiquinone/menaquinone biosynthesis C-methylase UbiE